MNDSPLKPASSRRKKMDKTMMAIYFLILFIVAGAALLAFLCLSKPSDKKNNAGSDPSIASSSTLKNSHQTGTDTKSTAKAKIKEEKPIDPYENLAVLGTCFRGGGGTILKRKNGWTKIRSGGLEGWLKDDYLVFGDDIKPLAKELGLYIATVSTQTLHVREEASTDSAIVGLAAAEDYYPVLSQETGWVKIQLSVDTSGYVSSDYVTISVKPGRAISIEAEMAALEAARQAAEEAEQASRAAEEAQIAAAKSQAEANAAKGSSQTSGKSGSSSKKSTAAPAAKSSYVISASESDVYLLSACLTMEANGGSYESYLAVGSLIVNRVKSGKWGKSISSVIYADGQFPGATSGLLDKYLDRGPSSTATKAAKAALAGANQIGDYLYFTSTKSANYDSYSSYQVVGGNCFYKK